MEGEAAAAEGRHPLKPHPLFNNHNSWKHKLRENCYKRVREDRRRLLWKMRMLPTPKILNHIPNFLLNWKKIKESSLDENVRSKNVRSSTSIPEANDVLWEYDGLTNIYQGDCEEILLAMQRIFYEDLTTHPTRKEETEICVETWEDEEDEYLSHAIYEHMQLNDKQMGKEEVWCPVCKHGVLQENYNLIYCTSCKVQLNKANEVNLGIMRGRLAEVHTEHLDRGCKLKPKFCIETRFNITALVISNETCGLLALENSWSNPKPYLYSMQNIKLSPNCIVRHESKQLQNYCHLSGSGCKDIYV
ncbi:unnamed protein product [Malus baccata var. baccata]